MRKAEKGHTMRGQKDYTSSSIQLSSFHKPLKVNTPKQFNSRGFIIIYSCNSLDQTVHNDHVEIIQSSTLTTFDVLSSHELHEVYMKIFQLKEEIMLEAKRLRKFKCRRLTPFVAPSQSPSSLNSPTP
ncbi:hypothetical protein Leryth_013498 [Lithospermum erythrorhizon]|nr:hypothetical protein Leryth_013498 [Lithospermum erythrorhizon]